MCRRLQRPTKGGQSSGSTLGESGVVAPVPGMRHLRHVRKGPILAETVDLHWFFT